MDENKHTKYPIFKGDNYVWWKHRMEHYVKGTDYECWLIIKNGPLAISVTNADGTSTPKSEDKYVESDYKKVEKNSKAMSILQYGIGEQEINRISGCTSAKEIWDTLCLAYEGTSQVKKYRINLLMQQYEMFNMTKDEFSEVHASFSIGNFIPWLGWIDEFNGVFFKARKIASLLKSFVHNRIEEHINGINDERNKGDKTQDLVDVLLEIQSHDSSIDEYTVKALLMDMVAGGIETTATLLEWTMSELLIHPLVLKKLQEEVRGFLKGKTLIDEDDLKSMMYLKAVIKESLRLHPSLPFLLLRESSQDARVQNYDIAAGTQVIINAWAIQRHPAYWEEPEEFRPERFINHSGSDFKFIPFGAGRRGCPGVAFANVEAELTLANLVGQFNWKLPGEVNEDSFMSESFGISLRRRDPLVAIPTPYSNN